MYFNTEDIRMRKFGIEIEFDAQYDIDEYENQYAVALCEEGSNRYASPYEEDYFPSLDYWLNYVEYCDRLEFRIFDGTLDPALAQTWVTIASAFVDAAVREDIDEILESMPDRLYGWHVAQRRTSGEEPHTTLIGAAWEKDTEAIRQFVDLLFARTEDKERVITLFAANDWNMGWGN